MHQCTCGSSLILRNVFWIDHSLDFARLKKQVRTFISHGISTRYACLQRSAWSATVYSSSVSSWKSVNWYAWCYGLSATTSTGATPDSCTDATPAVAIRSDGSDTSWTCACPGQTSGQVQHNGRPSNTQSKRLPVEWPNRERLTGRNASSCGGKPSMWWCSKRQ